MSGEAKKIKIVVFAGPSLNTHDYNKYLTAVEFRPPIKRNDIKTLLLESGNAVARIGIIDGCFLNELSISPKEIIMAMDMGLQIWGSSSMGALRAAELDRYGMNGVGKVYSLYASGIIDGDDEVALVFDQKTYMAQCIPMVNVRCTASSLLDGGQLQELERDIILDVCKGIYFPSRNYNEIFSNIRIIKKIGNGRASVLKELFETSVDTKHEDAIKLLEAITT